MESLEAPTATADTSTLKQEPGPQNESKDLNSEFSFGDNEDYEPDKDSELVISCLDGLKPVVRTFEFTLDFNVFNDLVEATYRHVCVVHPSYSENVSMGMFSYYCAMALWYRLYAIKFAQGGDASWDFPMMKFNAQSGFVLPKPIHSLLNSVGDFTDPNLNCYWKMVFPHLNTQGHFGAMSADTFYKYMAYPAPAVLVATLRQELDMILDKTEAYSAWRLGAVDYDGIPAARVYTKNVCGYYIPPRASVYEIKIDDAIGRQLSSAFAGDFDAEKFAGRSLVHPSLVAYITKYNTDCGLVYPMEKYVNESKYGSVLQMGFVEASTSSDEEGSGGYFSKYVQGFSPVMLPSSAGNLIPVLRLRAKRTSRVGAYPYDFPSVEDIPAGWADKLNTCFDFGGAKNCGWNCGMFSTASVDSRCAISEYVTYFSK